MQGLELITSKINNGGEITPFLLLSSNLELLNGEVESFVESLLQENNIDMQSLFHLRETPDALKIDEVKNFLSHGEIKPRFKFQVFLIENISRMTTQAQNACLKFFEEPGSGNIIILTNHSEAGVLETILSRVQLISLSHQKQASGNQFYYDMIASYLQQGSDELIRYMFSAKLEKSEYIIFLTSLIEYISKNPKYIGLLDEIHEDISGILKNNLQGKYIVDKYIVKLRS